MNIIPGIQIVDLFLYIDEFDTLVIGDAHLGYEDSLNRKGILVPKFQFPEIMERLKVALEELKPTKTIILGDLKHDFGYISKEEWRQSMQFLDLIKKYSEIILIKGNHDAIAEPIAKKQDLELFDSYVMGEYYFCHGHVIPTDKEFDDSKLVIMGHEHPAVSIHDGPRSEIYKCFLYGDYKKKKVIVLPSISSMPEGSDVTKQKLQSPFLKDINNFEVFVVHDKAYNFGTVKKLKNMRS